MDSPKKDIQCGSESSNSDSNTEATIRQNEVIDQLTQRLSETQMRIRNILVSLPLGLLLVSDGREIVASNSRIEQIFGYHQDELSGKLVSALFPDLDTLEISNNARRVIAKRKGGEVIT